MCGRLQPCGLMRRGVTGSGNGACSAAAGAWSFIIGPGTRGLGLGLPVSSLCRPLFRSPPVGLSSFIDQPAWAAAMIAPAKGMSFRRVVCRMGLSFATRGIKICLFVKADKLFLDSHPMQLEQGIIQ